MRWNEFVRAVNALEAEATALENHPNAEVIRTNLVSTWLEDCLSGRFLTELF